MSGKHQGRQNQRKDQVASGRLVLDQPVSRHTGDQDREADRNHRDKKAVENIAAERHRNIVEPRQQIGKVICHGTKGQKFRREQKQLIHRLKGCRDHINERKRCKADQSDQDEIQQNMRRSENEYTASGDPDAVSIHSAQDISPYLSENTLVNSCPRAKVIMNSTMATADAYPISKRMNA